MPRRSRPVPDLKFHAPSGQFCVYLQSKRHNLGSSKTQARRRYRDLCRDLVNGREPDPKGKRQQSGSLNVAAALARYFADHAVLYFRGQPQTLARLREMASAVRREHGDLPADGFRGPQLKRVREYLLAERKCKRSGRPLSRTYINYLVRAAQRCWKWLKSEDLVSADCVASLLEVEAIHKGKGGRESARILPPRPNWTGCFHELSPTLYAMVRVQGLGGMRPQDICGMRRRDISATPAERVEFPGTGQFAAALQIGGVSVWAYVPSTHKTAHLDKPRAIPLGPDAQVLLAPLLAGLAPDDYVFDPRRVLRERRRGNRFSAKARRRYTPEQYAGLVERAIERTNRRLIAAGVEVDLHVPRWTPNQLRHLQATVVGEHLDAEHARALLGHSSQDVISRYMEQAFQKAARAAAECG